LKIGIVVDGDAEYASLTPVVERIRLASGDTYLRILKADIQPLAPIPVMARGCLKALQQLRGRGAESLIVVLDRETTGRCAIDTSRELSAALRQLTGFDVDVVVKDAMFENWLLSDLAALRAHRKRFKVSKATQNAVEPNKADGCDAATLVRRCVLGSAYDKVEDARTILASADPVRMGMHSRSWRRFMRVARHPIYGAQSKRPA
jgi:hypothetical protein